jgi:hypothetical protein
MILKRISAVISAVLVLSVLTYGQGNTFNKVRYNGGSIASTVKPDDWKNTLIVDSDKITFKFKDGVVKEVDPKKVTGLSYGSEASRKIKTIIVLAVLLTPIALFGLFHKNRKHFVGIEWNEEGDKKGGVLLQGDKNNYKGMLMALRGVTGAPVAVAASERKYVPTGVDVIVTKDTDEKDDKKKDETKKDND